MKNENVTITLRSVGLSRRAVCTAVLAALLLLSHAAVAQPAGDCFPGSCSAQNFNLVNLYLGDINGVPLPEGYCSPGDPVTAYIWINMLYTQAADRQSLYIEFDLWQNGVQTDTFYDCFYEGLLIPGQVDLNLVGITWVCGDTVELKNLYVSWGPPNAPTCICSNAQCYSNALILVDAPLIPNFEFEVVCEESDIIQRYQFTNLSTGGEGTLSYAWDFGVDGSGNTSAEAPLVSYASTGVKQVTLTVTDSRVPPRVESITLDVPVTECPDPQVVLTKTASPQTYGAAGDIIQYTILVENTGNVPLSDIVVSDPQATSGPTYQSGDDGALLDVTLSCEQSVEHESDAVVRVAAAAGQQRDDDPALALLPAQQRFADQPVHDGVPQVGRAEHPTVPEGQCRCRVPRVDALSA